MQLGVLKKVNRSEWAAPAFIWPEKDGTVRFVTDFRELNKRIRQKPYPIPKTSDLLQKPEGFTCAMSLDPNMGCCHVELSPSMRALCASVLPWGKCECQRLPMGLCNSADMFQEKMGNIFADLEFVRACIDDLLVITKGDWNAHLARLDEVFQHLGNAGLKVNAQKSFFGCAELECLGFWITQDGVQPLPKKAEAIKNIAMPKNKKDVRSFIGVCNFCQDMWQRRAKILAPLASLTSKNAKWEWTDVHQKAFDDAKCIVRREVMLAFPDFNKMFNIHTDASDTQLGAVLSQDGKPVAFCSRKLNGAQKHHAMTERELLVIAETSKEHRNILLGHKICIYTDHKNLTCKNFNTDRVSRWRLLIEEHGPELICLPGEMNVVTDALSHLPRDDVADVGTQIKFENKPASECAFLSLHACNAQWFGLDENDDFQIDSSFPLSHETISNAQSQDHDLLQKALTSDSYSQTTFRGGGKSHELMTHNGKTVIPKSLQQKTVDWHHGYLCHPGETHTKQTIWLHYHWQNMQSNIHDCCKKCHLCQVTKWSQKKHGHAPPKEAEIAPWDASCVDLIGPCKINRKNKKKDPLTLWALTMIDPATGWFEIRETSTKAADNIANVPEQAWLSHHPWPSNVIFDCGSKFKAEASKMLKQDCGVKVKTTATRNPQANSAVERMHQTVGNMIRMFQVCDNDLLDDEDPWAGILTAIAAAVHCTCNATMRATPVQLVFGRDFNMNTKFITDWDCIHARKQEHINDNNARKNRKHAEHTCRVGDEVLLKNKNSGKFDGSECEPEPCRIATVCDNGMVQVKKCSFHDVKNIRQIKPCFH